MIASRIILPESKPGTVRGLREETASSSLGKILGLSKTDKEQYYIGLAEKVCW